MYRLAVLVLGILLTVRPVQAQDIPAAIDSIFGFATSETPGCAVGVSQHGQVIANRSYGLAGIEPRVPLSPGSRFDIGSTQKQFVAAAVLLLVNDGRLTLTDDIRTHIPELRDYGHRVTLDHLLTHRSGIRDWTGMLPMAEEGTDVLDLIVRQRSLNFVPGEEWSYSNSGYVLLKEIVARVSGMSFADFARTRLFEPLGMTSTAYVSDVLEGGEEVALGYRQEGAEWTPFMRLGNERGGGAIISTTGDLLTWNDALTNERMGPFVTRGLQEPTRLNTGRRLTYARGLIVEDFDGVPVLSHSGGAAGYSTWLGRFPAQALSVVVMCNFDPVSATALAGRVSDLFLPPAVAQPDGGGPEGARGAPATAGDMDRMAGLFLHEQSGDPLRLSVNEGRLQIAGGPPLVAGGGGRFRPRRPSLFFRSQDNFELHFEAPDQIEFTSMEGRTERYRRAEPYAHTPEDIQSFEGLYHSEELGSTFEILSAPNGLVVRFESAPERAIELAPVERDTWMRAMAIVRFRRDDRGAVVGFDYGNPVVRGIKFMRLGQGMGSDGPHQGPPPSGGPGTANVPQGQGR